MCHKFIIVFLGLLLSSCVVLHEEYYYPQASGASVEKEWCHGGVGVDNQLIFKIDDVNVRLEVWEYKGVTRLGVSFEVYAGANVVWPSQVVIVHSSENTIDLEPSNFTRLRRVSGTDKLLKKVYPVDSIMSSDGSQEFETYYESFVISNENTDKVKIEEIRLVINGKERVLSDLYFTKKSGFFLHPLNC